MIDIVDEAPAHVGAREVLLDLSFGPDRFAKTSERLREGRLPAFAYSALDEAGALVGTVRLWNVADETGRNALLLGPLAVETRCRSQKVGERLMRHAINQAAMAGFGAVILVGDHAYYQRFGFNTGLIDNLTLPGPVERARFLALELKAGHLAGFAGCLLPTGATDLAQQVGMPLTLDVFETAA